jgi:hypothetical protein
MELSGGGAPNSEKFKHSDADRAFEMLIGASQQENCRLRGIAHQIERRCWRPIETVQVRTPARLTDQTNPPVRRSSWLGQRSFSSPGMGRSAEATYCPTEVPTQAWARSTGRL